MPVDVSITARDESKKKAFTVWNDRPQAGAVHYDKSVKLLIERAVRTKDKGGIGEEMYDGKHKPSEKQTFNFQVMAYPTEAGGKWLARRERTMLALNSNRYSEEAIMQERAGIASRTQDLVTYLKELKV